MGSGPHDGEDLPSFATFLVGSILLLATVVALRSVGTTRRRVRIIALCLSSALVAMTLAWWILNAMLERWAA